MIAQQPKPVKDPNIVCIKSATREHPKTSHILSNTIKQAMKFSQIDAPNNPSYRKNKKSKQFFK